MKLFYFRWYIVCFLLMIMSVGAYFYLWQPQWLLLSKLEARRHQLQSTLAVTGNIEQKNLPLRFTKNINKTEWLDNLTLLAQLNGVIVQSIAFKSTKANVANEITAKLIVEGDYSQLVHFIAALHDKVPNGLITYFMLQLTKQYKLRLSLDLLLVTKALAIKKISLSAHFNNPFCLASYTAASSEPPTLAVLREYPLNQMKMVGRLSQGERQMALVMLPTGVVVDLFIGNELGVERGVVTGIKQDQLEIVLQDKEKYFLKM